MLAGRLEKTTAKKGFGDTLQCCSSLGVVNTGAPVVSAAQRAQEHFGTPEACQKVSVPSLSSKGINSYSSNYKHNSYRSKRTNTAGSHQASRGLRGEKERSRREDMNSRKRQVNLKETWRIHGHSVMLPNKSSHRGTERGLLSPGATFCLFRGQHFAQQHCNALHAACSAPAGNGEPT